MEKVEYKDKVINKVTNAVVLDNVFTYYDEENEVYWVSDNLLIDDEETKVDITFLTTKEGEPFGVVYNSYFNSYDILQNDCLLREAYANYKKELFQRIIQDKNHRFEEYKSLSKKFIASRNRKNGKENE